MKCPKCHFENAADSRYCSKCGTRIIPVEEIPLSRTETLLEPFQELTRGSIFAGRYEVIEQLGTGGMGKVYRVFDKKIEEEVALKLLRPEIVADEKTIARFRNELKFSRKIVHKNVCRMYDLSEDKGDLYITMEYVPGEDLKSLIKRIGQFSVGKTVYIAKQVCEGLAEAHKLGVVHRDLKPQNIMIDKDGNAHIMDFGIARSIKSEGITDSGVIIGTPHYMSPEQVEGKEVDQRSDIYSFGVILYEMLTARLPFEGETPIVIAVKHKSESPPDPREFNPQLSEEISRVILRCLEKDRNRRFHSIEHLYAELDAIKKEKPTTSKVIPEIKFEVGAQRRYTFPLILFLVAITVVGGYFFYDRILKTSNKQLPQKLTASGQTAQKTQAPILQNGFIEINSEPVGAEVYINDKNEGVTPFKRELSPGAYKLIIKKYPEYEELTETLDVKAGETYSKNYTLIAKYGLLNIDSAPKGAEVHINDKREGVTPLKRDLPSGTYVLKIKKPPEYEEIMDVLAIKAADTISKTYTLNKRVQTIQPGYVEINSTPDGAEVYFGDKREGVTPFKGKILRGTYNIRILKLPEYKEKRDVLNVISGETLSKSYVLTPLYMLKLSTNPQGADVRIDGVLKGKTPIEVEVPQSVCRLRIEKGEEWSSINESLTLKPGINSIERSFERAKYYLTITTNPPGANVYISNNPVGVSPVNVLVFYGYNLIRIEKEGYKTIEESITLKSDVEKTFELTKLKIELVKIRINVQPYADVLIDGKLIGEVPPVRTQEVEEGKHTIEFISARLNKKYSVEVEIKAGESKEIRMNMETGENQVVKIDLIK